MHKINEAKRFIDLPEEFGISDMSLSVRAYNVLFNYFKWQKGSGLFNVSKRDLLKVRNCGPKAVREVEEEFAKYGIHLLP